MGELNVRTMMAYPCSIVSMLVHYVPIEYAPAHPCSTWVYGGKPLCIYMCVPCTKNVTLANRSGGGDGKRESPHINLVPFISELILSSWAMDFSGVVECSLTVKWTSSWSVFRLERLRKMYDFSVPSGSISRQYSPLVLEVQVISIMSPEHEVTYPIVGSISTTGI